MRFPVLLFAALRVPSTSGFNTTLLSGEYLGSLPGDVTNPLSSLKDELDASPSLHFDEGQERWGAKEIDLFNSYYYPTLKELVTVAARYPELMYKTAGDPLKKKPCSQLQPQPLRVALGHLLSLDRADDAAFTVVPARSELTLALMMAKADFMALRDAFAKFNFKIERRLEADNYSQWIVEASTLGPVAEIARGSWLFIPLFSKIERRYLPPEKVEYLRAVQNNIADLPILTKRLSESIGALSRSFLWLQAAAEELARNGCDWSWLGSSYYLWSEALSVKTKCILPTWGRTARTPRKGPSSKSLPRL